MICRMCQGPINKVDCAVPVHHSCLFASLQAYEIVPVLNRHYETGGDPSSGYLIQENQEDGKYYLREDVDKLLGR